MDNKALIKIAAIVIVGGGLAWAGFGMLGGEEEATVASAKPQTRPNPDIPKQAPLMATQSQSAPAASKGTQPPQLSEREMQLMQMQQATEEKYIAALEQLQLLLVQKDIAVASKDIANANKDVMKAKKDSIAAQKGILDMLAGPKVTNPSLDGAQQLSDKSGKPSATSAGGVSTVASGTDYSVVSVVYTRNRWVAVLSASSGKLYSVSVGDTLADDGSTVTAISRAGVTLDKSGATRKIAMASVI
jgi:hypothetical protein